MKKKEKKESLLHRVLTSQACLSSGLLHTTSLDPSLLSHQLFLRRRINPRIYRKNSKIFPLPPHHNTPHLLITPPADWYAALTCCPSCAPAQLPSPALLQAAWSSAWAAAVHDHPAFLQQLIAGYVMVSGI